LQGRHPSCRTWVECGGEKALSVIRMQRRRALPGVHCLVTFRGRRRRRRSAGGRQSDEQNHPERHRAVSEGQRHSYRLCERANQRPDVCHTMLVVRTSVSRGAAPTTR
jgi:hypothetical protein